MTVAGGASASAKAEGGANASKLVLYPEFRQEGLREAYPIHLHLLQLSVLTLLFCLCLSRDFYMELQRSIWIAEFKQICSWPNDGKIWCLAQSCVLQY